MGTDICSRHRPELYIFFPLPSRYRSICNILFPFPPVTAHGVPIPAPLQYGYIGCSVHCALEIILSHVCLKKAQLVHINIIGDVPGERCRVILAWLGLA